MTPFLALNIHIGVNIKWIQSTYAGVDGLFKTPFVQDPPKCILTKFGGKFGKIMTQYCLQHILNHERHYKETSKAQKERDWSSRDVLNGNEFFHLTVKEYRKLEDLSIGLIGYGDIAKEIARTCKFFDMKVHATKRNTSEKDTNLDELFPIEKLDEMMKQVDYLISIIPSTSKTKYMLSNENLKNCKNGCVFINIGRGDVIDEESLLNALDSKWIDKAIMDVFEFEPLPKESKLWDHENVVITPHISGVTFPKDIAMLFIENLKLFERGEELKYVVDWNEKY